VGAALSRVPVVFHLDHGADFELVKEAIVSGYYTSVMYDGSRLSFEENAGRTRAVVKFAHKYRVAVEAEFGAIMGVEDGVKVKRREAYFTDPAHAADFVRYTGCDALAVAVGTSHGPFKAAYGDRQDAVSLDLVRLEKIGKRVKAPLVLHGASGVSKDIVKRLRKKCGAVGDCARVAGVRGVSIEEEKLAIRLGVAKINIDTDLRLAFTAGVREAILTDADTLDPRKILGPARDLMREVAKEKMKLFGSARKA
jgi:fructose-bisphosphate aldolase class II